ncbi:MAG TPA: right-handed parallel beta-helix repeat-containing protein [Verrucomicrobiae bacterium]|nr:right-handed parallel beta-helix repeat-containing protein [Verrucomicrobiae bacterium]
MIPHFFPAISPRRFVGLAVIAPALCLGSPAFGQGSLTPAGAPAATMKSLDQVEPRVPVDATHTPGDSQSLYIIRQPGSYYLTANVAAAPGSYGIAFRTNDITLDLHGFALIGGGSGNGIGTPVNLTNLVIRNGTVRNWSIGIDTTGNRNTLVENVLVTDNGSGMTLGPNSTVRHCKALANAGNGIYAEFESQISQCTSSGNGNVGFVASSDSVVEDCFAQDNAYAGIEATGSRNRIDNNHCDGNNYGLYVDLAGNNVVIRNTLLGNTNDIVVPSGNKVGPIVADPSNSSANAWANIITSLVL